MKVTNNLNFDENFNLVYYDDILKPRSSLKYKQNSDKCRNGLTTGLQALIMSKLKTRINFEHYLTALSHNYLCNLLKCISKAIGYFLK